MAETDPYATSYAEKERTNRKPKVPILANSVRNAAAKRLRKESLSGGNHIRQEIEARAPNWKNEPNTTNPGQGPKGSSIPFHPGSYETGLHYNLKHRRG